MPSNEAALVPADRVLVQQSNRVGNSVHRVKRGGRYKPDDAYRGGSIQQECTPKCAHFPNVAVAFSCPPPPWPSVSLTSLKHLELHGAGVVLAFCSRFLMVPCSLEVQGVSLH